MRIPLRELEQVRMDPGAYLRKKQRSVGSDFYGRSKYAVLKGAALKFHDLKNDLAGARKYLEDAYAKQFKEQRSLQVNLAKLEKYAAEFRRLGNNVFKVRDRLILSLPETMAREVSLSAQIPRLDLTKSGYAVWFFAKEPADLRGELRMPLIQEAYSKKLGAPLNEITVGVYDFASANYESYMFTQREINKANLELAKLLERLASMARPKTLREF